ncbi:MULTISPECIES: DegT/DnrJ/EryC1/StrS family aminotransferase [Mycobacterium]|uniref:DegT/DnrJ/EryC1/StrS aminotransferase family protein n=1 Tax=Mycobacterium TaxID=1763 RepID=UPI001CD94AD7|nr:MULTISPECIES: DegT/DnrJ/EryC1/StrS family aminotransferase [Mycobacterium]MCA2245061.1 DegT/DnrJ/EryC1/StrS family aminotransferase [Mycobacterium sp. WUMAC-067]MCA2316576.1 DegT/DnrJ/EryC1/StrS family aminotransferase [Mycobacterium sp. WUMAC-025]MEE3754877.1 DegT/DnrJ/EryC1/StrS family aminotransferase [Mycobacterium intracellulare]
MATLAIAGGSPLWQDGWPAWPQHDARTSERVVAALGSGRWTVSSGWTGAQPYEQVFARRFAEFVEVPYCVSTDHGSSSLMIALEALGVGAGDEVIVPVLTWVATATAVLNVNAVPVFVDVDPQTGCMDPRALSAAVTERTRAVTVVHLHCRMADMDAIGALAAAHGLPVVEDCAQAHGARWGGRPAGSLGAVGAFSMQQGKVLTCGEGGAVVTKDPALYDRLQQLRADARRYPAAEPDIGYPYLVEAGEVMGTNHCLAELPAALLLDQLERLPQQLRQRARAAELLDSELAGVPGVRPMARPAQLELPSIFAYTVRRDPGAFADAPTDRVCAALAAELGLRVYRSDRPLHDNILYCPQTKERYRWLHDRLREAAQQRFPAAEALYENLILLPHRALLSEPAGLEAIVAAFHKVATHADEL